MNINQIKPMPGKIIVKRLNDEKTTKSGIILTKAMNERHDYVEIVSIGKSNSVANTEAFNVGDKCLVMGKGIYDTITLDDITYFILNPADIYAILE